MGLFEVTRPRMRFMQMSLVVFTGAVGLINGMLLGKVSKAFHNSCLLFASVRVKLTTVPASGGGGEEVTVEEGTTWGDATLCDFVTFQAVFVFISCLIWFWFFIHMDYIIGVDDSNGRKNSDQSRQSPAPSSAMFVLPPVVINTVLCVISIVKAIYVTSGFSAFCDDLCTVDDTTGACIHSGGMCKSLQTNNWQLLSLEAESNKNYRYHDTMSAAITLSWIEALSLGCVVAAILAELFLLSPFSAAPATATTTSTTSNDDDSHDNSCNNSLNHSYSMDSRTGSQAALWPKVSRYQHDSDDEAEDDDDDGDDYDYEEEVDTNQMRKGPPSPASSKVRQNSSGSKLPDADTTTTTPTPATAAISAAATATAATVHPSPASTNTAGTTPSASHLLPPASAFRKRPNVTKLDTGAGNGVDNAAFNPNRGDNSLPPPS